MSRDHSNSNDGNVNDNSQNSVMTKPIKSKMMQVFGFDLESLRSWNGFVKLMNRPEDPSALAFFRIAFGDFRDIIKIYKLIKLTILFHYISKEY